MFNIFLVLLLLLISVACIYLKHAYKYWKRHGIQTPFAPSFPFGNFTKIFMQKCTLGELMQEFYYSSTEPLIGVYAGIRPMIIVRDMELIQKVLINDFQHFQDRGWYSNEKVDPMTSHLVLATGERWKRMRAKMTPAFTMGKLRAMLPAFANCGEQLYQYVSQFAGSEVPVEMYDTCSRYTINNIAHCAFGLDINCFENPNEPFMKHGRYFFEMNFANAVRQFLMFMSPKLMKILNMRQFDKKIADFMIAMAKQNLELREQRREVRKDFFQILVQMRNGCNVTQDGEWEVTVEKNKALTIEEVAAQAYMFLAAGYESSATTISFCLYELASYPQVQARLHDEIDRVLNAHDGQATEEALMQMKYLDCCLDETLRKYPPLVALSRECTKDYQIPHTEQIIEKGTPIMIPVWALHYDEKFYPDPQEFIPERFSDENRKSSVHRPWLPFGDGPRACIGIRMGRFQTKIGLISLLRRFRFSLSDGLLSEGLKISKKNMMPKSDNGIPLKVTNRF